MQKMVVASLAAALLTEMRHALCLWLPCAPLLTSTRLRAPHALCSSQPTPARATASLSASSASVPERALPSRPLTPCPLLLASHSLSPSLYSPDRPGLQGGSGASLQAGVLAYSLQYLIPFLLPTARLPRNRLWRWGPLSRTSVFLFMPSKSPLDSWLSLAGNYPGGPGMPARIPGWGVGEEVSTSPWSQSPAASLQARGRTSCLPAPSPFLSALPSLVRFCYWVARPRERASARTRGETSLLQLQQRFLTSKQPGESAKPLMRMDAVKVLREGEERGGGQGSPEVMRLGSRREELEEVGGKGSGSQRSLQDRKGRCV